MKNQENQEKIKNLIVIPKFLKNFQKFDSFLNSLNYFDTISSE